MKQAAGTLLFRWVNRRLEVLLVQPSSVEGEGPKPWSIPKGLIDRGETPEEAARRETWEEAGVRAAALAPLGTIQYTTKSRKIVFGFYGPAPADADPHCPTWETDRAEFVTVARAKRLLHRDQVEFVERLERAVDQPQSDRAPAERGDHEV